MGRLLFDVTRLMQTGLHTGIQRVVRCLLDEMKYQLSSSRWEVLPVSFIGNCCYAFPYLAPHPLQGRGSIAQAEGQVVEPGLGDIILLFDSAWYGDPWLAIDAALGRGARLCGMIHDLLPLEKSGWFPNGLSQRFEAYFQALAQRAECLFVPSVSVYARLEAHLALMDNTPPISLLPLGGNFCSVASPAVKSLVLGEERLLLAQASAANPLYLMLGTIEPRKNHSLALDAFERQWERGSQARLLFVGRLGWQVDELLKRLAEHPQRNRRLFHIEGLDDPSLLWLLRHSTALLFLSSDEGFGLPILEASMQGCPIIAADIPVLREVGENWPRYIEPGSAEALIDAINTPNNNVGKHAPHRSWSEVACRLASLLRLDQVMPSSRVERAHACK